MEKINFVNNSLPAINDTNLNKLQDNVEDAINNDIFDLIYPIGSIYMSVNTTNPSTLFGGTWEKIKDRFLLASGDNYINGNVGGESQHTLTTSEMPTHSHKLNGNTNKTENSASTYPYLLPSATRGYVTGQNIIYGEGYTINDTTQEGNSQPFDIMPPYLVVNVWKRIG